jgi:hypothetical protein
MMLVQSGVDGQGMAPARPFRYTPASRPLISFRAEFLVTGLSESRKPTHLAIQRLWVVGDPTRGAGITTWELRSLT